MLSRWIATAALVLALVGILVWDSAPPAPAADPPRELLVDQVRKAIERGVQFLRDQENGTGNWERSDRASVMVPGGWSSLAMLALLNAGVKPDDPIIERGLKYLEDLRAEQTYVVALQTMVFAEADQARGDKRHILQIQRNVEWLIGAMVQVGGQCRGWTYMQQPGTRITDNSNTQYALLGLHAGHLAGAKIDRQVWDLIRDYYVRSQQRDGGWAYQAGDINGPTTLTMTTAGLCGLLISGMELNAGREVLRDDGTADNCGVYEENRPVARALGWVSNHFRIDLPYNTYYNLYGIERAGRLSGLRFLGGHDWYREGCEFLVRTQRDDGSWHQPPSRDSWPVVSTSFALLFLSKGRTPILISKFAHGRGDDWNNDRNDARHLVEYAGREVFRKLPMAWQIFDDRQVETTTEDEFRKLLGDLLQSPIVYFNGHLAPDFTERQKKLLKEYVEQGGFVLAEACCGRKEFDRGFRDLMRDLFPDTPLKKLPPDHPIWRAHAVVPPDVFELEGIEYGCKTVVVYSPQDLSCLWEANQWQAGGGQEAGAWARLGRKDLGPLAFRLGGNIIAYATGLEPPKPRLTPTEVIQNDPEAAKIRRGFLKVAQLRHDGDWHPAPNAMRNLMDHLRKTAQLDVVLQTQPLYASDPELLDYKFLYMHGRGNFRLADEGIKNLRLDLEMGGLLFADACCGKKAFDASFRELAARLFPDKKLEPIPLSDDLYSKDLNGTAITAVRCRTEAPGGAGQPGDMRDVTPYLEGIKVGNRWVVIYSKYDIGCALEKHQSTDCLGHDHASALKLASAAVLYALKR